MSAVPAASARPNVATSIAIVGVLFFLIGFFTWLNGPLITFVKLAFELSEVGAFLVLMVFYLSYFFLALPASWILRRTGMKKGLSLSLLVMAGGAALFGEFATQRWYPGALGGLFVIGSGLALLQTAINPYISILGPIETAARRIALMGICNKIAGMLAPVLIGTLVLHGIGDLDAQVQAADAVTKAALLNEFAAKIHTPYLAMAALLVVLAVAVLFSPLPEIKSSEANATPVAAGAAERRSIFQFPHLWLGVLCLFVYVGVEVMAGDAIGTYGHGFDLPLDQTKMFTSLTLGAMLVGYVVGLLLIPNVVSQSRYLTFSAVLGVVFCLGAWATHGYVSVAFVALLGFANAMMWPAIFPLAIRGLGRFTETGSALLVMGIAGGAIIPQLFAVLKQHIDFQLVFVLLMVPCYLYILFYSVIGHRAGLPQDKA
ncbi:sugar MFS transporter [Stenotrophomonas pavanii]|uniref:MFS transporter n=1 Tax=Stenotrophomonas pavanii TaxID=487698 RepID=A0A246KZZ5_9GAMM|nr:MULTISPECIES: sugar MFS transporter [Stenotrophomonas]KAA3603550.1 glucose/galactose MFS transporter [Stenotrophomonas maltophilia]TGR53498.1 glucose/galactose MFS transporter [bacterium M00.F.Ca.ET.199.01.1.1]TGT07801.1 glucose/galactose MFS transporter [bacterium M00.F.Ca.ET.177.01.1.1]TGT65049.1 glucose/galactose MFS transporter [Mesorhizobium sp. M00.F.Ca.ET.170.01.1.1]TGU15193.1 glucose/galactose MFS transporter [bacterium M00.F.Ca.ET.163.01.1.1]TGU97905.1 glucose/galactose MFS transp